MGYGGDDFTSKCLPFKAFIRRAELASRLNARGVAEFGELEFMCTGISKTTGVNDNGKIFDPIGDLIAEESTEQNEGPRPRDSVGLPSEMAESDARSVCKVPTQRTMDTHRRATVRAQLERSRAESNVTDKLCSSRDPSAWAS